MIKKVFLLFFCFFSFTLVFPLPVRAQVSLDYDVGPNLEDYVWPHSQHRWRTIITNGTSVPASGRLDATYEAGKYSSTDPGNWVRDGGGLRYDYSLVPFSSKTIDWFGTLNGSDSECVPINDVISRLRNNGSLVATEIGTVLASVYLTLRNQTVDSITVSTSVNGAFNDTRSLSPGGSSQFRITAGGVDGGGSLFSCSRPFSYSFTVTGVAGATYSCSVADTSLVNNCTSEHTATCTKTTGPTPTLPPGVPSPTPVPPTTSPPLLCNFSDCGAHGCGSKQRWVSGNCWSYSWFGGNGCYDDDSCSVPIDCKPKYCHLLVDSQSGFECGETFNSWKPGGSASQTDDRYDHGVQTGQWSLRVRYTGASDTPYYSAYTVVPSAPSSSQQAKFYGKYYVLENTVGEAATLKACVQYFSNWPNGYLGEDCVGLNASLSTEWLDFEITSSYRPGANQVLPKFDVAGSPGKIRYHADSLCLQFVSGPTPTPTPPLLPCPASLNATCNANGTATFSWTAVTGAVSYILRANKDPYADWFGPGDFTANPIGISYTNPLSVGVSWEWSIHPIAAGEIYSPWQPNVCYAKPLYCPAILKSCNADCTLDSECATGYCAHLGFLLDICRNKSCPADIDCVCPISWFQTTGGDIQSQGDITSIIPACATTSKYLSKKGGGGSPGVVGYAGDLNIGTVGEVSETRWRAKTRYNGGDMKFDYLKNRLKVDTTKVLQGSDIPTVSGTYYLDSEMSLNLNGGAIPNGRKIVIFVTSNVTVTGNITVASGGFFALISKGNITFDDTATQADGFYLSDEAITVAEGISPFSGQGSFIGWEGISFLRDLIDNCSPAETFIERPDFYINAPDSFKLTNSDFKEIEP